MSSFFCPGEAGCGSGAHRTMLVTARVGVYGHNKGGSGVLAACYCCDLGGENAAAGPYFQQFFQISINAIKCSTGKSLHLHFSGPGRVCLFLFNSSPWSSTLWFR